MISVQQQHVRAWFPDTPASELKLLPSPRANPDGRRPVSLAALEGRHRDWVDALGVLRTRDGAEFDKARAILYAYRHTYVMCTALPR